MQVGQLGEDRFLRKEPAQTDQTKGAAYTALNPAPKRGNNERRKIGQPKGSEEDDGAPNILTGTVITSCFIQTSALPSRIELQGNDLTFFDNTYDENGQVIGDTSRLIFTHASGKQGDKITEGFIMEKRASELNTYDNVLSWYALPASHGGHNFMFIGRDGHLVSPKFNVQTLVFAVDQDTAYDPGPTNPINGIFQVEYAEDGVFKGVPIFVGASKGITGGAGFSAFIIAGNGGISGLAYQDAGLFSGLYMQNKNEVALGLNLIPDADGVYDIGSPSFKIATLYGSVVACPLPTVENALELLDTIPAPTTVGDRGHYGDGLYFDDLTFPPELLFTDKKGRVEIEHNHVLGFLLKAVIELKAEVDFLKNKAP